MSTTNGAVANPFQLLDQIDLQLLRRHYRDAVLSFFTLLDRTSKEWFANNFVRAGHHGEPGYAAFELCERAARQWYQILSSDLDLTKVDLTPLVSNIGIFHSLIMGSAQGSLDDFISAQHRKVGGRYQTQDFLRILLAWCPTSRSGFDILAFQKQAPELVMAHALGCVSGIGLISEESDACRNRVIDFLIANENAPIERFGSASLSSMVLEAWMRCSYANHPGKHKVKLLLNRIIRSGFERYCATAGGKAAPELPASDKPIMVVPIEVMPSTHAMYRCYADILAECRTRFYTVGLASTNYYDDATCALFDQFYNVNELSSGSPDKQVNLRLLEDAILSWKPDIVYYPSIGMSLWVIAMANRRLAPVQAMTFGHPATSMSESIDYALLEQGWYGNNPSIYSEKIVTLPDGAARFQLPPGSQKVEPVLSLPPDGVIRIAIPSISQKLTAPFIRALRRVEINAGNRVQFVFFVGAKFAYYAASVRALSGQLKNLECFGLLPYDEYIFQLNRCHLHAGTFPFGGTNSLIDSLRQGLPILALEGDELHSRIDGDFVRRVGLPAEFVCHNEDEYVERMTELVSSPETLRKWRSYLVNEVDVDRIFLQDGSPDCYVEALAGLIGYSG